MSDPKTVDQSLLEDIRNLEGRVHTILLYMVFVHIFTLSLVNILIWRMK